MSGDEMAALLLKLGWSSHELARRLSVRPHSVAGWTSGRRDIPPNLADWLELRARLEEDAPPLPDGWERKPRNQGDKCVD